MKKEPKKHNLTDEELLVSYMQTHESQTIVKILSMMIQGWWLRETTESGVSLTEGQRYDAVINQVRTYLEALMPEHEEKARTIFAGLSWPLAKGTAWIGDKFLSEVSSDFGPIPTFEKILGQVCPTCNGTGVAGFISGIRCPDC